MSGRVRAAEYVRMSTEGQQYSIPRQQEAIREYAAQHGLTVLRTYADPGKSGLRLKNLPGLIQLFDDVQHGTPDFDVIQVRGGHRGVRGPQQTEGALRGSTQSL